MTRQIAGARECFAWPLFFRAVGMVMGAIIVGAFHVCFACVALARVMALRRLDWHRATFVFHLALFLVWFCVVTPRV